MSNCKLLLSCMRTAQRCWRGHKSDVLTSTGEGGVERCAGIQLCFTHESFRDAGRQGGVINSSLGFLRAELLHITQSAWLLPCHEKPLAGIYNQFCYWSVTSQPRATSPARELPQIPRALQRREEEEERGRPGSAVAFAQGCFGATTAPPAPGKPAGILPGIQRARQRC